VGFDFRSIDGIFFDFDGVLTDNKVIVSEQGIESVICSRADGLGFDALRDTDKFVFIFSTEKNEVVVQRAKKLNVEVINAISNKGVALKKLSNDRGFDLSRFVYVGNDLNDFHAMNLCGLKICPSDAHDSIKKISDVVLDAQGGNGVVREILENVFSLDLLDFIE